MKTEKEIQEKFDAELAALRAKEKRARIFKATRTKLPTMPAHALLALIRTTPDDKRLTEYPAVNPYNPAFKSDTYRTVGQLRWIENTDRAGLRFVGHADELDKSIQHNGWYIDSFQDDTYRGAIWQLPGRNRQNVYVVGYVDPNNPGAALIDFDAIYGEPSWRDRYDDDDLRDAARAADRMAELFAEAEREFQLKDAAERRAEELREEAAELRRGLCEEIQTVRKKIASLREEADRLIDEPWLIESGY